MKQVKKKLLASLFLALAFVSQSAFAIKCEGWVTVNGETLCSSWKDTFSCEDDTSNCIPTRPPRPSVNPSAGTSTGGPSPSDNKLTPDEMNCKQLEKQISEQVGIIKKLRADVNQFNGVLEVAKAKLEGAFTESAENSANAAKTADCDSWQILILKGEMQVCTEPTNGKPPKCHFRPLKPNERNIKNKCDVSTANAKNIHDSRENLKQAESNAKAFLASAQTKINVAVANLNKLREAKDGKLECY